MGNRKTEYKLLYDPAKVATRIEDLRKGNGTNSITLEKLSNEILSKTGVSISAPQLGKYENADLRERPNANNLLALANYYDVSIGYLLGLSESRETEDKYVVGSKEFGLSDEAMEQLIKIKCEKVERLGELSSDVINLILANCSFWNELDSLLPTYFIGKYVSEDAHYFTRIKFELNESFIQLIDDVCKGLLIAAAEAEEKGLSIFGNSENKGRSYKSLIEKYKNRGWVLL